MTQQTVLHIASREDWLDAQRSGEYRPGGFDAEGFIHCCFDHQLESVLATYFAGVTDYVVLELQNWSQRSDLKLEPGHDGQLYPHVYNMLRPDDLKEISQYPPA